MIRVASRREMSPFIERLHHQASANSTIVARSEFWGAQAASLQRPAACRAHSERELKDERDRSCVHTRRCFRQAAENCRLAARAPRNQNTREMKLIRCTALITGASAGLGAEFARQLAGRAGTLILAARRIDRLEELRAELTRHTPNLVVHIRGADLSKAEHIAQLCEWLQSEQLAVDLLINNAGLGDRGSFATSKPNRVVDMLQVNVVALTALTRALLGPMRSRKRGAILNVSSCASFLPMPGFAVYAATKAYVTSFSEALRGELRGTGISVTALCPGPVHTEFDTVALRPDEPAQQAPEFTYVSAEQVVCDALAGVERDRPLVIPGMVMKIAMLLVRLLPMPVMRLTWRVAPR